MPAKPRPSTIGSSPCRNAFRSIPEQNEPPAPVSTPTASSGIAVEGVDRRREAARERAVHGVAGLRPVQGDHQDRAVALGENFVVGHSSSRCVWPQTYPHPYAGRRHRGSRPYTGGEAGRWVVRGAPGRPVRARAGGVGGPVRDRPGGGRRRRLGLCVPGRRADLRHRAQRRARRGLAGDGHGRHARPAVRVEPAVGALRGGRAGRGAVRRGGRGRRGVDVAGADGLLGRGRRPVRAALRGPLRRRSPQPGRRRRDDGRALGPLARRPGRVLGGLAREGGRRPRRRPVRRADRAGHHRRRRW